MQIGIIGTGPIVAALAIRWAALGHELVIAAEPDATEASAFVAACRSAGGHATLHPLAELLRGTDVVVLATPWEAILPTLTALGRWRGPIALVLTCRVQPDLSGQTLGLLAPADDAAAEVIGRQVPGAKVVAAFPLIAATTTDQALAFLADAPEVPLCGKDPAARGVVADLFRAVAARPHDLGAVAHARVLETLVVSWQQVIAATRLSAAGALHFQLSA